MRKIVKHSLWLGCLIVGLCSGMPLQAQRTLIDVKLDSAAILIGEQTVLHLTVTTDRDKPVFVMIPPDTLMRGVEVLDVSKPDSTLIENNRMLIRQDVRITSFDSALYLLPPVRVIDGTDTIVSNRVALKVSTLPVNVDKPEEFYDIKNVWRPPFVLADYYPLIFGVLVGLFLICVAGYIVQRLRNRQSVLPMKKEGPKLPPHEQAMQELDRIKAQKLWQQGRNKEYYTAITETLRRYVVDRFGVNAMEMTSGEILDFIRRESEAESVYANLRQILQLSDLVKFAKWAPLPDENDLSLMNAYLFVNQTKVEPVAAPEEEEETGEEESDTTIRKE